jgi:F-type H+-transporting ATPase subunit a
VENIGKMPQLVITLLGKYTFTVNHMTILMSWITMAAVLVLAIMATRRLRKVPGRAQALMEMIVDFFDDVITETLGKEAGRRFFPFIMTIFFFMLVANWLDWVPFLDSPTADLNTPLAVGILVFIVIHYSSIKHKGFTPYCKSYFEPVAILMPLNVVGVLANIVSLVFRIFGNIMGGGIIIIVVSQLVYDFTICHWALYPTFIANFPMGMFLNFFFVLFVGTVQAFVYTMLSLTYIAVQRE